tara:strand:+ start:462 stop:842 length:381 start_codon:yes stop_codon:yes gene_type:complete
MKITRDLLRKLRKEIEIDLKVLGDKNDVVISCGNCTYGDNEAIYKLKINTLSDDGKVMTTEYQNLLALSKQHNFDINGIYNLGKRKVKLVGWNYKAPKFPLQVVDISNGDHRKTTKQWFDNHIADQ